MIALLCFFLTLFASPFKSARGRRTGGTNEETGAPVAVARQWSRLRGRQGRNLIVSEEAQTRMVSEVRIRRDSWKFVRPFKGIICDDISEFESYMASHAVTSLWTIQMNGGSSKCCEARSGKRPK